jgi:FMN phosphatase YigB (HAD superfamily)
VFPSVIKIIAILKFRYFCVVEHEAIIFDLGGVLLNLDYGLTSHAFKKLGLVDFDAIYSQAQQEGIFDDFETGRTDPAQFRERLRFWLGNEVSDKEIDHAWNAMLLDLPLTRIKLLKNLKEDYRIFLLSNTNEIHLKEVFQILTSSHGFADFSDIMEKQYFSCRLGLRKPDPEIFYKVLEENNLTPEKTLFIDDSIQHIKGAQTTGLKARLLLPTEDILDLFPSYRAT